MEEILNDYRKENSHLQSQINDYQTFSLEMIRVFHNRVQEKIVDEDIPDFMRDLYTESPTYLENDSLKGMLETFSWMSLSDKEKRAILDDDLDTYFSKFDAKQSGETNLPTQTNKLTQTTQSTQSTVSTQSNTPTQSAKQSLTNQSDKDPERKDGSLPDVNKHSGDKYSDRSESSVSYTDDEYSYDEYSDERYTDESYSDESPLGGDKGRSGDSLKAV